MKVNDEDRLKNLLRQALPPVVGEPAQDLWPAVLRRLDARPASLPWFDWAMIGGLLALGALFPGAIPMFLYYL